MRRKEGRERRYEGRERRKEREDRDTGVIICATGQYLTPILNII